MNVLFSVALSVIKSLLITLLSKKAVEYLMFSFLEYLVKRTDTKYDDELLNIVRAEYEKNQ